MFLRNDIVLLRALAGVRDGHAQDGPDRRDGGAVLYHGYPSGVRHARAQLLGHSGNVLQLFRTA